MFKPVGLALAVTSLAWCVNALAQDPVSVSGTITEQGSGATISGATVVISDGLGPFAQRWVATTDAAGDYSIVVTMTGETSRSVILEAAGPAHAPARLGGDPDLDCYFACGSSSGAFDIEPGDVLNDQDLALAAGGRFSGTVLATDTATGLSGARVAPVSRGTGFAYSEDFFATADASGNYLLPLALPVGQYHARASAPVGANYATVAWDGFPCQFDSCAILATGQIAVTSGAPVTAIDFELAPGSVLRGSLMPDDINRIVRIVDGAGSIIEQLFLAVGESAWEVDRLSGGSYYLELGPFTGQAPYVRQLHNGLPCPFSGCNRASGPPLSLPSGTSLGGIDVTLTEGGQVAGRLIDSVTGLAPDYEANANPSVTTYAILDISGAIVGGGSIVESGGAIVLSPSAAVAPGSYYVRTYDTFFAGGVGYSGPFSSNSRLPDYADAMYPNVTCAGVECDLSSASTVAITAGSTTSIDIQVEKGSNISGSVIDDDSNLPIANAGIVLFNASNERLAAVSTGKDGTFFFGAFPAGSYSLRTAMSSNPGIGQGPLQNPYFDRVLGSTENCSELLCGVSDGTPLVLDGSTDASGLTFRVESGPVISGQIFDQLTGLLINRGIVEVRTTGGTLVGRYRINSISGEYQTTALPPGTYTLTPVVSPAYIALPGSSSPTTDPADRNAIVSSSPAGTQVTLGTESIEADLAVVDAASDGVFADRFRMTD